MGRTECFMFPVASRHVCIPGRSAGHHVIQGAGHGFTEEAFEKAVKYIMDYFKEIKMVTDVQFRDTISRAVF